MFELTADGLDRALTVAAVLGWAAAVGLLHRLVMFWAEWRIVQASDRRQGRTPAQEPVEFPMVWR